MKRYKKYATSALALLLIVCLPASSIASEWRIGTPWKKVGPNVTLAVPTDRVGIGTETPNNRLQVAELINFNDALRGTLLGFQAGNVSTGWDNTFIGFQAGLSNTTGGSNTFIGRNAGQSNTIGGGNIFVGVNAGQSNTTGENNIFIGLAAGLRNTVGVENIFIGSISGFYNTTGNKNVFIGMRAGRGNTADSNTFVGYNAGFGNTTGARNTFIGRNAGIWSGTGSDNTFIGMSTGVNNSTGHSNTFVGVDAGHANTTGFNNIFTGLNAGRFLSDNVTANTTSNNSVFIGNNTRTNAAGNTNEIVIGADTVGSGSNSITLGNADITRTVLRGSIIGGTQILPLSNPGTITVASHGFLGATTWGYRITAQNSVGETLASAEGRTTNGLATLSSLGFSRITWAAIPGAANYRIYRTIAGGTPATTGLIGTTALTVFDDTGLAAVAIPIPMINTTGNVSIGITPPITRFHVAGTTRGLGGAQFLTLSTPTVPTVTPHGVVGTTTWGYRITARSSVGETLASIEGRTTTGNATLSTTNFNRITWSVIDGAVDYRIYRTTAGGTPATTGLIGVTAGLSFDDTGLAATTPVPTVDTSGSVGIGTATPAVGNRLEVHDGHIVNTMTTPPIVTCNVGIPTIIGTDMGGAITVPAGASSCTITFTIPWNQIYGCVVSSSVSGAHPFVPALSNTSATFNFTATAGATTSLYYHCSGR